MSGAQLAFDLGHRPAQGRDDFLVAPCNQEAVAWLDRWPDWPAGALAIVGPPGCGKSHLASVWRARTGALSVDREMLDRQDPAGLAGAARACVLDGQEEGLSGVPERERALLHLYNLLRESGGYLLLTGRTAPARWPLDLPDLRSRLATIPAAPVGAPDEPVIAAILIKLFADRQLKVAEDVIEFILPRIERSFEAARRLVISLDGAALAGQRPITVPLVRQTLAAPKIP